MKRKAYYQLCDTDITLTDVEESVVVFNCDSETGTRYYSALMARCLSRKSQVGIADYWTREDMMPTIGSKAFAKRITQKQARKLIPIIP